MQAGGREGGERKKEGRGEGGEGDRSRGGCGRVARRGGERGKGRREGEGRGKGKEGGNIPHAGNVLLSFFYVCVCEERKGEKREEGYDFSGLTMKGDY